MKLIYTSCEYGSQVKNKVKKKRFSCSKPLVISPLSCIFPTYMVFFFSGGHTIKQSIFAVTIHLRKMSLETSWCNTSINQRLITWLIQSAFVGWWELFCGYSFNLVTKSCLTEVWFFFFNILSDCAFATLSFELGLNTLRELLQYLMLAKIRLNGMASSHIDTQVGKKGKSIDTDPWLSCLQMQLLHQYVFVNVFDTQHHTARSKRRF